MADAERREAAERLRRERLEQRRRPCSRALTLMHRDAGRAGAAAGKSGAASEVATAIGGRHNDVGAHKTKAVVMAPPQPAGTAVSPAVAAAIAAVRKGSGGATWVLLGYEASGTQLKVESTGTDGGESLPAAFDPASAQWALLRTEHEMGSAEDAVRPKVRGAGGREGGAVEWVGGRIPWCAKGDALHAALVGRRADAAAPPRQAHDAARRGAGGETTHLASPSLSRAFRRPPRSLPSSAPLSHTPPGVCSAPSVWQVLSPFNEEKLNLSSEAEAASALREAAAAAAAAC